MKRTEMIERLTCFLSEEQGYREDRSYAEMIIAFLESQGMQPPAYTPKNLEGDKVQFPVSYNEWEDEE